MSKKRINATDYLTIFGTDAKLAAKERDIKKLRAMIKKEKIKAFGKAKQLFTDHGTTIELATITVSAAVIRREEYNYQKITER